MKTDSSNATMLNNRNVLIALIWAIPVILMAMLHQTGWGNVQTASLLLVIGSLTITGINWHVHRGGRSPSFIFLILGCIFLCGRAFPVLFGGDTQLARIPFGEEFDIGADTVMIYVTLVLASFFFVHLGSLLPRPIKVTLNTSQHDARIYLLIFGLLLPFYLYKNYYYFSYIMASGGYLAIYLGTEHIEGIGLPIRLGALLCLAAFTLYFFHETDRKKSRLALIFFLVVFSSELLVGLRGKFFVVMVMLFLFYKLRFGGKFSIRGLLALSIMVFILAIAVEVLRQGGSSIEGSIFMGFLLQQGVTAGVNLVVLENLQHFASYAGSYFFHQFAAPFYSQPEVQ
ncbi:MAG TPA: O-antigen polysaccharide polymerase Wzy, partial [Gammaproteobacteria bacterium]|nr:O-antigen polysaccharide polymerase Wzy [Gammaproteobacteria bacterium]